MFLVPVTPTHAEERDTWSALASGTLAVDAAYKALCDCRSVQQPAIPLPLTPP